jgi:hypothetical protein
MWVLGFYGYQKTWVPVKAWQNCSSYRQSRNMVVSAPLLVPSTGQHLFDVIRSWVCYYIYV